MMIFRPDPCGIVCIVFTYGAVVYADYVVVQYLVLPSMSDSLFGAINTVIFNILLFLLLASHLRAMLSDPGIVPIPSVRIDFSDMQQPGGVLGPGVIGQTASESSASSHDDTSHTGGGGRVRGDWTACRKCEAYRPPRAHHCRTCKRCIRRMDHHCPWVNNCIGEYNQKYFIQFLFYVGLSSLHAIILVALSWFAFQCEKCDSYGSYKQTRVIHSIVLTVECLLFGVFVIAIMCDQLNAVFNDESPIDHMQRAPASTINGAVELGRRRGASKTKTELLRDVFGYGNNKWFWLCPFQSGPPSSHQTASLCRRSGDVEQGTGHYTV